VQTTIATTDVRHGAQDDELLTLAAHPAQRLLPVLRHASAMSPLVILMAVLPGLWAMAHTTLTEISAQQGIRGLALLSAESANDLADPDAVFSDLPLHWQPPLLTWLTALCLRWGDASQFYTLILAPFLCTCGVVALSYSLAKKFGGARVSLFTVFLLGSHPQTLQMAQTGVPLSAAILMAMVCLWAVYSHLEEQTSIVSFRLLLGGIGLGACLLASGVLSLAVFLLLVLHVLTRGTNPACQARGFASRRPSRGNRKAWRSLLVLAATAFAVGGWWALMMTSRYGSEFLIGWLSGVPLDAWVSPSVPLAHPWAHGSRTIAESLGTLLLFQIGLVFLGIWRAVRLLSQGGDEPQRHAYSLLLAWSALGLTVWWLAECQRLADESLRDLWQMFFLIPLMMLAALGMREIVDRRVSLELVLAISLATFANVAWQSRDLWGVTGQWYTDLGLLSGLLLSLILGARQLAASCHKHDARQRVALSTLLLGALVANCGLGLYSARRTQAHDQELAIFRKDLLKLKSVASIAFVSPRGVPSQLNYLVRSLWPRTPVNSLPKWESAIAPGSAESLRAEQKSRLLVCWNVGEVIRPRTPTEAAAIVPIGTPKFYKGRDLTAYSVGTGGL
jgi:4-amino-4-deoxy-L-arabinose transferase-like glycosyltransferase